ncbi:MAG: zinc ribbon domain-containing protein [Proteobacteria bacterium]|nr:zinc ribbon domain-containing protein [Pseudomonadota bacterium]MBU1233711.1 zinc ribbon domain-containing protein [Pseudomonadota bacterium]MBU1420498.1 zinc ribbon domain-containing protein [Pseudomonadota bacterium]MBU1456061.1 zinc ribbon domain-containing protein [Pseudomonadota bacterium]
MNIQNLSVLDEEHICPSCKTKMSCCEVPPVHVGDGLGWGSEVLFICLNDDCPTFRNGWDKVDVNYGHKASFRDMQLPGSTEQNVMMVASKDAFTGSIVDPEQMREQNERNIKEKEAVAALDTCVQDNDISPVMTLILDEAADNSGRLRAISLLKEFNDLSCIDAIRNHTFNKTDIEQKCKLVISQMLKDNYKKECPYCAELIKAQAKKCMHCNADF